MQSYMSSADDNDYDSVMFDAEPVCKCYKIYTFKILLKCMF